MIQQSLIIIINMASKVIQKGFLFNSLRKNITNDQMIRFFKNIKTQSFKENFVSQTYIRSCQTSQKMILAIEKQFQLFKNKQLFENVAIFYDGIRMKRDLLCDMMENSISKAQQNHQISKLFSLYNFLNNLKHQRNIEFKVFLRKKLLENFLNLNPYNIRPHQYYFLCLYLEQAMLDFHLSRSEKQTIYKLIQNHILIKLNFSDPALKRNKRFSSNLYEILELQSFDKNNKFGQYLKRCKAEHYFYVQNKAEFNLEQLEKQNNSKEDKVFKSTFEKIFNRALTQLGYDFETNIMLNAIEYDVMVKGIKRRKNIPFQNINIFQDKEKVKEMPRISEEKLKQLDKCRESGWYEVNEEFKQKVIFQLNGPYHYINDEGQKLNEVPLLQQLKYRKLQLSGIKSYSLINYEEWEKISKHPLQQERFLLDKIQNPKIIA